MNLDHKDHLQTPLCFADIDARRFLLNECFLGVYVIVAIVEGYGNNHSNPYFYSDKYEEGYVFDNDVYCHQKMTSFDLFLDRNNNVFATIVFTNSDDLIIKLIFEYFPDIYETELKYIKTCCSDEQCYLTLDDSDVHCSRCGDTDYFGNPSTDTLKNWLARRVMKIVELRNKHLKHIDAVFLKNFIDVNAVWYDGDNK
jgi:hypothetical protein